MRIISALLCLFLAVAFAQTADRDAKWREDVDALVSGIQQTHPDPAFKISRNDFQAAATALKDAVPQLSDAQVVAGLSRLAALLGDGHTNVNPLQTAGNLHQYPLRVKWFADGLFVTAVGPNTKGLMGRKVISIGGMETEAVFQQLKPFVSYENEAWAREMSQSFLTSPEMLAAAGAAVDSGATAWELEDAAGNRESNTLQVGGSVTIDGPHLSRPGNPMYRRNPTLPYWFGPVEGTGILYFKYLRCEESPALSMEQFTMEFAEYLKTKPSSRVVFDLRDNMGGNTQWLDSMITYLMNAYIRGEIHAPVEGFYAIVGRRTFSSAAIHAARLRGIGFVMVGEPTGGNPSSFGEVKSFVLPNSRLVVSCSSKKFEIEGYPFNTPVPVHVNVIFNSADFFSDLDPFLEAVRTAAFPQA